MKKKEKLELVRDVLGLSSKHKAAVFLEDLDKIIEAMNDALEVDERVRVCDNLVLKKIITPKNRKKREGVLRGRPWVSEPREKLVAEIDIDE